MAAQSVVKLCMDRKGTDNITTILVCLGSLGLGASINEYASVWVDQWIIFIFVISSKKTINDIGAEK